MICFDHISLVYIFVISLCTGMLVATLVRWIEHGRGR